MSLTGLSGGYACAAAGQHEAVENIYSATPPVNPPVCGEALAQPATTGGRVDLNVHPGVFTIPHDDALAHSFGVESTSSEFCCPLEKSLEWYY